MNIIDREARFLGYDTFIGRPSTYEFIWNIEKRLGDGFSCWRSQLVERRGGSAIEGQGLFAKEDIQASEVLAIKGGRVVPEATVREMTAQGLLHGSQQQIGFDKFLIGLKGEEDANLVGYNHSCNPNSLVCLDEDGYVAFLFAGRPIVKGEEVTVDYSVTNISNTHRLLCRCGAENCRGIVQPRFDYMHREFQDQHSHEFPPYLKFLLQRMSQESEVVQSQLQESAFFGEFAGRVVVLADAVDVAKQKGWRERLRRWELEEQLLEACGEFAGNFRAELDEEFGISRKD